MAQHPRPSYAVRLGAATALALALAGCGSGGLTAAERSRATTLPSPSAPSVDAARVLADRVDAVQSAPAVGVDENLVVDDTETAVRLVWVDRGRVLHGSLLTIGSNAPGVEVFRSPSAFLARKTGDGETCWSPAPAALARFDRPAAQELALLASARATSGAGALVTGSVSARSALRILGTDDELRRRTLLARPGARVRATFGTTEPGLVVTVAWSDLVAAAGGSSRHGRTGTWTLRFTPSGRAGPIAPSPGQVVPVGPTDPTYAARLAACNARIG